MQHIRMENWVGKILILLQNSGHFALLLKTMAFLKVNIVAYNSSKDSVQKYVILTNSVLGVLVPLSWAVTITASGIVIHFETLRIL